MLPPQSTKLTRILCWFLFLFILRQNISIRLTLNSLYKWGWSQTSDPSFSISWVANKWRPLYPSAVLQTRCRARSHAFWTTILLVSCIHNTRCALPCCQSLLSVQIWGSAVQQDLEDTLELLRNFVNARRQGNISSEYGEIYWFFISRQYNI